MLKNWLKIIRNIMKLRYIIGYNGFIFRLKTLPLIGSSLPDALYGSSVIKALVVAYRFLIELAKMFLGKIAMMIFLFMTAVVMNDNLFEKNRDMFPANMHAYLLIAGFLLIAYTGMLINTNMFKFTTEKWYSVFMLRMDAKTLDHALFAFDLAKLFIGYFMTALIMGPLTGAPVWAWAIIPPLAVLMKLAGTGLQIASYKRKKKRQQKKADPKPVYISGSYVIKSLFIFPVYIAAFAALVSGNLPPWPVLAGLVLLFAGLGIFGIHEIRSFNTVMHRKTLIEEREANKIMVEAFKGNNEKKQITKVKSSAAIKVKASSDKKGFEFFNDLFFKRYKSSLNVSSAAGCIFILLVTVLAILGVTYNYYYDHGMAKTMKIITGNLIGYNPKHNLFGSKTAAEVVSFFFTSYMTPAALVLFGFNTGLRATQSMFINCDRALMTFNFFKTPRLISKLFKIRRIKLIKVNLKVPLALSLFYDFMLLASGGQQFPLQYLLTPVVFLLMSAAASVWKLSVYYLLQPFTSEVKIKSIPYFVLNGVVYFILFVFAFIPLHPFILAPLTAVIFALLFFLSDKLVYRYGSKTWRNKG